MKKKILYLFLALIAIHFGVKAADPVMPAPTPTLPAPDPQSFDDFLKGLDIDKMMNDMEKLFGKPEAAPPPKALPAKPIAKPTPKPVAPPIVKPTKIVPAKKEDKETLFKKPFEPTKPKDPGQIIPKLPTNKKEAYFFFVKDFLKMLDLMEGKIDTHALGIPFKEKLEDLKVGTKKENYKNFVNKFKVQHGAIESKSLYLKAFYLTAFNDLREKIINALKALNKLEPDISKVKEAQEAELFGKKPKIDTKKIKKDLEDFFTKTLPPITEKLALVTNIEQVKKELEAKVGKRKKEAEAALAKEKQRIGGAGRPSRVFSTRDGDYGYTGTRPWGGPGYGPSWTDPGRSRWGTPPSVPTKFEPTKDTGIKPVDTTKPTEERAGIAGGKEKKEFTHIVGLKNQIAQAIKNNIVAPLAAKEKDKKAYEDEVFSLLQKDEISNIASTLQKIKDLAARLSSAEKEALEKREENKKAEAALKESLSAAIPHTVKLCKHTPLDSTTEHKQKILEAQQAAGLSLLKEKSELAGTVDQAVTKYEEEIFKKIDPLIAALKPEKEWADEAKTKAEEAKGKDITTNKLTATKEATTATEEAAKYLPYAVKTEIVKVKNEAHRTEADKNSIEPFIKKAKQAIEKAPQQLKKLKKLKETLNKSPKKDDKKIKQVNQQAELPLKIDLTKLEQVLNAILETYENISKAGDTAFSTT